jgi:carbon-monoxide dehydrogenase large subunit
MGRDLAADGLGGLPLAVEIPPQPGTPPLHAPPRPLLQADAVRFVGDPVALVLAETRAQAQDAAS